MKRHWMALLVCSLACPGFAQEPVSPPPISGIPVQAIEANYSPPALEVSADDGGRGFLTGDKGFPNFIGFSSNPSLAVDPRSLTQLYPIYSYTSLGAFKPLPAGDMHAIGPGLNIALTERLNVGMTKGAYVVSDFRKQREGWLDLGGYVQYTVIRNVPNQFLATAGLGWTAPSGSHSVFQGSPPAYLAPYVTAGKEFGEFHVLATTGFQFPAGSGDSTKNVFYGNVHLDRRCLGWLYPLVEFNWAALTSDINLELPTRRGSIDFGTYTAYGNIITVAAGLNAVLIKDKLELGAVYQTPIASQHNFHFNSLLVKLVLRY